jgi:fructuronate reductase
VRAVTRLSEAGLGRIPAAIARPRYDRAAIRTGIVHLGLGAFHRAHMAAMTEDCLDAGARDWGITAASLRRPDTRDALAPQDGLYTLALRESGAETLRVIGAVRRICVAPEDPRALLAAMADPAVRIVSLTVTEKGYAADIASGALRIEDPDIRHDLAHPGRPRSALGFLAEALALRRAAGTAPFTILSCDNLPGNGRLLHRVLTQFAEARDPALGAFVARDVACPATMVDRIVPATTDADRAMVADRLGLRDAWPVIAEPFRQWVIEDRFPTGRPDWALAGAEFTADVAPFEAMKLRLLNGAHSAIAAIGRLTGAATVAEAIADPVIRAFVRALWQEVAPTIAPDIDVPAYTGRLLARFDNRALNHACAQIATDASLKVPQRLVAPLRDLTARGRAAPHLCFALAAWIRSSTGRDEAGRPMPISDPPLETWAGRPGSDAPPDAVLRAFLGFRPVFGAGLDARSVAAIGGALAAICRLGVRDAARLTLSEPRPAP